MEDAIVIRKLKTGYVVKNMPRDPNQMSEMLGGFTKLSDMIDLIEDWSGEKFETDSVPPNLGGGSAARVDIVSNNENSIVVSSNHNGGASSVDVKVERVEDSDPNIPNFLHQKSTVSDIDSAKSDPPAIPKAKHTNIAGSKEDKPENPEKKPGGSTGEVTTETTMPESKPAKYKMVASQRKIIDHLKNAVEKHGENRLLIDIDFLSDKLKIRNADIKTHLGALHRNEYILWEKSRPSGSFITLLKSNYS